MSVLSRVGQWSYACFSLGFCYSQEPALQDPGSVWRLMVAAKGGEDRLLSVRTLVRSWAPDRTQWLGGRTPHSVRVAHFPHQIWDYDDGGSKMFDKEVTVGDLNVPIRMSNGVDRIPSKKGVADYNVRYSLLEGQIVFLVASAWVKPRPVCVKRTKKDEVLLEADLEEDRIEYYIDDRTWLPKEIVVWRPPGDPTSWSSGKRFPLMHYLLERYREVQGIQMPHRTGRPFISTREVLWERQTYEVDPPLPPDLFSRMPAPPFTPDMWKRRE